MSKKMIYVHDGKFCGHCYGFQMEYGEDRLPDGAWTCICRLGPCCGNCSNYAPSNIGGDGFCLIAHEDDNDTPFDEICHNHTFKEGT